MSFEAAAAAAAATRRTFYPQELEILMNQEKPLPPLQTPKQIQLTFYFLFFFCFFIFTLVLQNHRQPNQPQTRHHSSLHST